MELAAHGTSAAAVSATSHGGAADRNASPAPAVALRALHAAAHVQGAICEQRGCAPEPVRAPESAANECAPSSHELSLESGVQPASSSTATLDIMQYLLAFGSVLSYMYVSAVIIRWCDLLLMMMLLEVFDWDLKFEFHSNF